MNRQEYYETHKEAILSYQRAYYRKNKAKILQRQKNAAKRTKMRVRTEYNKIYYELNKDHIKCRQQEYYRKNKQRLKEQRILRSLSKDSTSSTEADQSSSKRAQQLQASLSSKWNVQGCDLSMTGMI